MPIQDSEPERRNLMITSIAFITYFYGEGTFISNEIRLQVINVSFQNPKFLTLMAWIAIFWFLYRYWQKYNGKFTTEFLSEFISRQGKTYVKNYLKYKTKEPIFDDFSDEGNQINSLEFKRRKVLINYDFASNAEKDKETGKNIRWTTAQSPKQLNITGIYGSFIIIRIILSCVVRSPSFSNYIIPYILFILAISGFFVY
ncbi:hypothetical protein [Thalassotalea agariperforans]